MKSIEYINDHRGIAGSSFKHSRDRVPVSNQVQSATGTRSYPPAWLPDLTELRQKPGGTIGFAGIPRRRCADWLVVALDRAITPLSPVLPPRPALPLLPGPKVSEPRRKSRRELPVVVRRRVFRARHACVSLFLSSLSLSVSLCLSLSFFFSVSSLYAFFYLPSFARRASARWVPRLLYDRSHRTRRSRRFSTETDTRANRGASLLIGFSVVRRNRYRWESREFLRW